MAQRRHHYERAFEHFLRSRRIPYIAVNEARKALLPTGAALRVEGGGGKSRALKSFDFVIYGEGLNLLVEIKGRKVARRRKPAAASASLRASNQAMGLFEPERTPSRAMAVGRLESWVTRDDVSSLDAWGELFGVGFEPAFVFLYWLEDQPPDALYQEVFAHQNRWYAVRAIRLADYRLAMRERSAKWGTVDLPADRFEALSEPFVGWTGFAGGSGSADPGPPAVLPRLP